ncbi:MAG: hypothetical protein K2J77_08920 [Oscillospiraceae bacterium]|nr:hypothetical protein [Oscillospiraceae bacterium]
MKTEKFFEAFTELDDDLIENAIPKDQDYDVVKPALKIHSWKPWVAGAAVAAAAVGVVFAGFKLFGGEKPGFAPALGDSSTLTGIYSDVSFDASCYSHFMADWVVYDTPEELVNAAQIICTGKVTDISFALLDNMTMRERSDDFYEMCSLFTIYEVETTGRFKGDVPEKLRFAVRGGLEGYKVEEQLALSEKLGDKTILVMDHHPEIEIGEEYLFILHWADNGTPTIINNTQTAFPLSDPTYKDSFSNASVNDILNCLNAGENDHYVELSITHDTQIISLSDNDFNELTAAVQDAMINDCKPELQLQMMISDQTIEEYGKTDYAIDLVFNDIDAPLAGGGDNKKAKTICHATVLIGENSKASYITYSYTSIGLDGSTEQQNGGTYLLGEKSRDALLAVIDASEQSHNNGVYAPECLFDYFITEAMPWGKTKDFTLPEYPDVTFRWSSEKITAVKNGKETELFWGMPVWGVYLADLNGDGKREICSTASMGSGMIDERVYVFDYANGKLYELQDRFVNNFTLRFHDGVLMYVKTPEGSAGNEISNPLTLDIMSKVPSTAWNQPDTTSHHDEPEHTTVSPTPTTTGTHHSEHDETHH